MTWQLVESVVYLKGIGPRMSRFLLLEELAVKALIILVAAVVFGVPAFGAVVGVDFDQTGAVVTQSGFNSFARLSVDSSPTSQTFGPLTVTIQSPGYTGNLLRTGAGNVFTNSGAFTFADLM